jgi:DNA-binding MarR family transcriptional regulator
MTFDTFAADRLIHALREARRLRITSISHVLVLTLLSEKDDGALPSQLAKELQCTAAGITGVVEQLCQLELVERVEGKEDRRNKRVMITVKGLQAIARMLP